MKKLEDIPKKEIFQVPEGYFEGLPAKIQARIEAKKPFRERSFVFSYKLQYVLPAVALLAVGMYWFSVSSQPKDAESLLASVQTEDLIAYLNESDMTTEDLLEGVDYNSIDIEEIESEVYGLNLDTLEIENGFGELDLDNI